jgi:hypothetical protein
MTQEALKLALEALEEAQTTDDSMHKWDRNKKAITAIKEALAQTEQEPVACKTLCELCVKRGYTFCANAVKTTPIYTTPPQRTWVGLTNNELQPIADEYRILFGGWVEDFARAIEAKLKEKNT